MLRLLAFVLSMYLSLVKNCLQSNLIRNAAERPLTRPPKRWAISGTVNDSQVFRCPSLERRLAGLMHICGRVTLAEQREQEAANANARGVLPAMLLDTDKTAWITAGTMEQWLVEVGFLEELFGSSMHVELVRCFYLCPRFFCFLLLDETFLVFPIPAGV